jgi:hypothetical protein
VAFLPEAVELPSVLLQVERGDDLHQCHAHFWCHGLAP